MPDCPHCAELRKQLADLKAEIAVERVNGGAARFDIEQGILDAWAVIQRQYTIQRRLEDGGYEEAHDG